MSDPIRTAYNRCRVDDPLQPGDPRYVPLDEVRCADHSCVQFLRSCIDVADRPTHQLFSGFWGSGKTTELNLLSADLRKAGYDVVYVDVEQFLNLTVPAGIGDLLVTIAAGFDEYLERQTAGSHGAPSSRFWDRFKTLLDAEVAVEDATLRVPGVADLKLVFTKEAEFRDRLWRAVEARQPELLRACTHFIEEALAAIRERNPDGTGTVLILDSFEKLRVDLRNAAEVRQGLEAIFTREWHHLELPCHAIYTVPPWFAFIVAGAGADAGRLHLLPMCRLHRGDGSEVPEAIEAMTSILEKRVELERVFEDPDVLRPLVLASGGYLRDLLRMTQQVLLRIHMGRLSLPVSRTDMEPIVEQVLDHATERYETPITDEDIPLLARVGRDRDIRGHRRDELRQLSRFFDSHFILGYQNGRRWFDLHPLVRRCDRVDKAIRALERGEVVGA